MRSRGRVLTAALCVLLGGLWLARPAPASDDPDHAGTGRYVTGAGNDTHTPFNVVSMPALIAATYDGHALRLGPVVESDEGWERRGLSYRADGRRLTGALVLPTAPAPRGGRPVVLALHGWARAEVYTRGAGLRREEAALAAAGYAVLHPDYRNFAGSDHDRGQRDADGLGYAADAIDALAALRTARLPGIDVSRVGVLGRSMGGGVALQVAAARPGLVDAVLLSSPVSSVAADNLERFTAWAPPLAGRVRAAYGDPGSDPATWARYSSRSYFDRIDDPVRIHHGTADPTTPISWSLDTVAALRAGGHDAALVAYPGEVHRFTDGWPAYMRRAHAFLDAHLG